MSAQVIGYLGENGVRDVRIPIGHLLDKWQGLRPLLVMVPVGGSDDEAYPVQYTLDGTDLVWHVSDADTAVAGTTKAAVRMVDDGGRVGMDEPFQVIISPNLSAGGEPPLVIKPWVDKLATLVPRVESAVERAENAAQNWETGTAPNALALDGKPPEYYRPVQSLLINSYFRRPVNQRGKTIYTGDGNKPVYAIDGWYTWGVGATLTVNSDSITIAGSSFRQNVPLSCFESGKTYTYAIKEKNGTLRIVNAKYGSSAGSAASKIYMEWVGSNGIGYRVNIYPGELEWAVLYEGIYTAVTLPPSVPPDHTLELAKCQRVFMPVPTDAILTGFSGSSGAISLFVPCPYMSPTATPTVINGDGVDIVVVGNNIFQTCTDWTVNKYADGGVRITTPTTLSTFKTAVSGYVNTTNKRMFISCEP